MIPPPVLVDSPTALAGLLPHLLSAPRVAVDTESNSFYAYHERLCLLQVSIPEGDYLVDTLAIEDLSPLSRLFETAEIEKIFHAAEQDIRLIKSTLRCKVLNIFDTMASARIVGWKEIGYAPMLAKHLHVNLDKRMQRSNWGRRPLEPAQIDYAAKDTHYLARLRDLLYNELERCGRLAEAREVFARIERLEPASRAFDFDGFRWLKGAKDLGPEKLALLRELYMYRDKAARASNRPVFMVLSDTLLVRLAASAPDAHALRSFSGMTPYLLHKHGPGILTAIARGKSAPRVEPLPRRPHEMTQRQMDRFKHLREWRARAGAERGVDPDVILSNRALKELAKLEGEDLNALRTIEELGPQKLSLFGPDLLRLLHRHKI